MSDFPNTIEVSDSSANDKGINTEVAIEIDGTPYRFWEGVEIDRSFDSLADKFSLTSPWFPKKTKYQDIFRPFSYKDCAIYIGGKKTLTGMILSVKPQSGANSKRIMIEGYSLPGLIADVPAHYTSWPLNMNGLNLEEIAKRLCEPYNIVVRFEADPGSQFSKSEKIVLEPDEMIGNFLIKLARQRGLIISSSVDGELLFREATVNPAIAFIQDGKYPYINSDVSYNGQNRYSEVTAIGTNNKKGFGKKYTVADPGLKNISIKRPLVIRAQDVKSGGLIKAATAKLGRLIAESIKIKLSIVGWHTPEGVLYEDNQIITYQSDDDMIYEETDFLIRNCKYIKNGNSRTCDLDLVLPEAYNGQIRQVFPWD